MKEANDFAQYIVEMLHELGPITTGNMFGGTIFKVAGRQLGVELDGVLYFKVINEDLQREYEERGSVRFSYTRKDKKDPVIIKNWWSVPESALENSAELADLARTILTQKEL